ncbi:UDP-N-acetylmuramoyl-tripeptide--D-alanyl-D-alanine ligase [Sphingomonas sp. NSE70-1]|uniref:UDP-N-acetylmuramoyl-tripeptide--D-alanyl-D-alanine ligase n=1 Tax=Sphingomonas caseinilyticus TaxID=2908205 RepID=A0ABT0RX15_9SPHN|nr:UDP-N-acetylmuramoyl-tripeptide--D-alanyl-D-alanine ligase [Sphingomonas caseinilyticus]MCL6699361.1 UDP-N-acetylmuramoyl-tripeptide--D-alanyl-D-alanine ligase [Sphingomonas caseinilyticus]
MNAHQTALWTSEEIVAATGGALHGTAFEVSGVTFDSREVEHGWLFVAMPGTVADGHDYCAKAFAAGAPAALVSKPVDGPHILVDDVPNALTKLAVAARNRCHGKIIGVTGSVGKTSTKEALYAALERYAKGRVHRSVKSYNNHTGVPLSLARMPRDSEFAVLEMGMSARGEIAALTRLVRPHIAVVTTIASAHIEHLGSMEAIADAKGEIFEGLEPEGIAIVPEDSDHRDRLVKAARKYAGRTVTFGQGEADVVALHAVRSESGGSLVTAQLLDSELTYTIAQRGDHWVQNSLAVLAAVEAAGADLAIAGLALADMGGLKGRGERHRLEVAGGSYLLIDESYNANPASMAATLKALGEERDVGRRIAVLGPMRELGTHSAALHAGLASSVREAGVDRLILVGEEMAPLADALGDDLPIERAETVEQATRMLSQLVRPGDAVLVKASNSIGLAKLVERMAGGLQLADAGEGARH